MNIIYTINSITLTNAILLVINIENYVYANDIAVIFPVKITSSMSVVKPINSLCKLFILYRKPEKIL